MCLPEKGWKKTGTRRRAEYENTAGQLYTIEGIAAGLIMIMTAYLVVSATSVYTAGDTHISDMQLEQLGTDALKVMDAPASRGENSLLQDIIEKTPVGTTNTTFGLVFSDLTNSHTTSVKDHIQYTASYSYRNSTDVSSAFLYASRNLSAGEHAVRVTKWVIVNKLLPGDSNPPKDRAVLVEVLMWRD
ncbi:MAG TPA: hypothetical protein VFC43_05070 [Methanoregula sp.]|nr:hypothetical protein [Methanoregula sp.]